jgi:glycopeptide antibiotics resistance protein
LRAGAKLRLLAVVYAALLVAATLLPIRWEPGLVHYPGDDYRPQLRPFRGSGTDVFKSSHPLHMLGEHVGNVVLFMPLGFLLPLLEPRLDRRGRMLALGAATSLGIELSQTAMPGIHRADVNDLILNTLGVGLGWLALGVADRVAAGMLPRPGGADPRARPHPTQFRTPDDLPAKGRGR